MFTRRVALFGIGGAVLLTCGGGLARISTGYTLAPGDAAIGLTVKELAIVRAIVETLCPADGDLPSGIEIGVHQRIDEEVWASSKAMAADLRSAISWMEHLPLVHGWGGRFTHLSPADREACFRDLLLAGPGPIVQAATGLKQLCLLFYYARPETWPAIGYDGPWVATPKPPASSLRYAELLQETR